jgi:hypothetical protein
MILTFFGGSDSSLSSKKIIPCCSLILQRTDKATSLTSDELSLVRAIRVVSIDLRILEVLGYFLALISLRSLRVFNLICGDLSLKASTIYFSKSSIVIEAVIDLRAANV